MDSRLLEYYNRELLHVREMGGEFAKLYPKVASRLGLEGIECADPYVERLLEGFAFLAARVQLKIDDEFPRFTNHLLESVYPHYLAPTPSMAVVQLIVDRAASAIPEGFEIPRGSLLRSVMGPKDPTACLFSTGHDVTIWPVEVSSAEYVPQAASFALEGVAAHRAARSAIRLRLASTAEIPFDKLAMDALPLYLGGGASLPNALYERLLGSAVDVVVAPEASAGGGRGAAGRARLRGLGFSPDEALLPTGSRSFDGYRMIHEYFAFPARYRFVELQGLRDALAQVKSTEVEIAILLDRNDASLEGVVDASSFVPFCVPIVNLFPKRADRLHVDERGHEHHVVADKTRPLDFEIHTIESVTGFGRRGEEPRTFQPLYRSDIGDPARGSKAYFTQRRVPRRLSSREIERGSRTSYHGSEVFVSLVDGTERPFESDLRQLAVEATCSNRDLPLLLTMGQGVTDFTLEANAPVAAIRCLAGPSRPRATFAQGETAWRLVSHLSLNYLSIVGADDGRGAQALREMLALYGDAREAATVKQIEGVREVSSRPVVRRVASSGPEALGRGVEITLTCDESAFEGSGVFLLGAVLERFFAKYASVNSFTQTLIRSNERGEVMRWPPRTGRRPIL